MKFGVYSIRDVKTGFMAPTVEISDNVARRNFEHAVQTSDSLLVSHFQDFSLYKIAEFDSEVAWIEPVSPIVLIAEAGDCLA